MSDTLRGAPSGRSTSVISHRDTLPAEDLDDQENSEGARVRVAAGAVVDPHDTIADTERQPHPEDGYDRLSRTLAAGDPSHSGYDAHEEDELADPLIGLVVADRYRITERLGRGGMGIVYRVEHVRIGKILAMKLLAGELSANKEIVRRFKLEALTVSKLSSPHTVQVFDYGVWNHLTYLVMELVEGGDLSEALRSDGPLPFARLGRLIVQVCSSLAEAHEKGIVHRDIKPENIMIITDSRGVEIAKVLDFGLAKLRESKELNELTLQGAVVGTPYYMSPEQVHGEEVDGRTDVYSLGAVMFRALTGTYPFDARSPMGMFTKHLTEEPPSAADRAPELQIPEGVSEIIRQCMAKDPADRFQSVVELRDALVEELNALPLSSSDRLLVDDSGADHSRPSNKSASRPRKKAVAAVAVPADDFVKSVVATREELERYERKLRRNRYGAWALLGLVALGGLGGAVYAYREGKATFDGTEREPNDTANQATPLPLDRPVKAYLGRRPEPGKGDRDFFRFEVPSAERSSVVALQVSGLPNMPMCSVLYRVGFPQPLAQYCAGRPGQDLRVEALRLEPGSYLLAVSQDLTRDEDRVAPPIHENVSDPYALSVALVSPSPDVEIEPNDGPTSAHRLLAGSEVSGVLAWAGDEDVYCVEGSSSSPVRWAVADGSRPAGTVVEATPMVGDTALPLVRIHPNGASAFGRPRLEADVTTPWRSQPIAPEGGTRCLRLRLTSDPWSDERRAARPDATAYRVRLLGSLDEQGAMDDARPMAQPSDEPDRRGRNDPHVPPRASPASSSRDHVRPAPSSSPGPGDSDADASSSPSDTAAAPADTAVTD